MKSCTKFFSASRAIVGLCLTAFAFFNFAPKASAQGYDLFQTGSGAYVDLSSMGLGTVNLQGVPIQSSTGNTDTIMYRSGSTPTTNGGTVSTSVYALYMQSTSPVTYNGQSADVYVTINNSGGNISQSVLPQPDALTTSSGSLTVYPSSSTFDSSVGVNADIIFVQHGGSPVNPSQVIGSSPGPSVTMSSTGSSYTTTTPPNYPTAPCYPSGGFYPLPVHHGPHPVVRGKKNGSATQAGEKADLTAIAVCAYSPY